MRRCVGPLRVAQLLRPARGQRSPKGLATSGAEMCMCRRIASAASARPMVPVEPTAGGAASYSAVQLRRGQRAAHGPSWARGLRCPAEHAARCRSCGVADGVVNQVGPSCTAHGSSELVKVHTPRRGRPSCRNTPPGGLVTLVGAAPWSRSRTGQVFSPSGPDRSHTEKFLSLVGSNRLGSRARYCSRRRVVLGDVPRKSWVAYDHGGRRTRLSTALISSR
jgi:hypothetical protein